MMELIAAQSENQVIGDGMDIPWDVKDEQQMFKDITLGGTLIMGRKTFESVGRPLPGRHTIIITRNLDYSFDGCDVVHSLEDALTLAESLGQAIYVAGGGDIYREALPLCGGMHLTTIHAEVKGDITFPDFDPDEFQLIKEELHHSNIDYTYRYYRRKT
ncbi:MAG: dihydrofolate reductase [Pseudomonadales bacterium]